MAKFAGNVGYVIEEETVPDVWAPVEKVRKMVGDVISLSSSHPGGEGVNDNISLNHRISLIGDAYIYENYYHIRWVELHGVKWKVNNIEVKRPRIIVSLGGLWNGS